MLCIILYCLHNCVWEARDYLNNIVFDRLTEKSLVSLGNNISHTPSSARHSIHVLTSDLHSPPASGCCHNSQKHSNINGHPQVTSTIPPPHRSGYDWGTVWKHCKKSCKKKLLHPTQPRETINSNWSTFLRTKLQIVFVWVAGTGDSAVSPVTFL